MKDMANAVAAATARWRVSTLRVGSFIGLLVAALIAAAVAASFVLTAAVLNSDLSAQIRRATGFVTTIHGKAHFVLFPRPHIDIENISFANPTAGLKVDADGFQGVLRLLPLLTGRAEVSHAVLFRPRMVIDIDDRPMTPDSALGRAARAKSATPEAARLDAAPLGILDLVNGSARLTHRGGRDLFVDAINVSIDWRSLEASATVTGEFNFRNVPMQLKAWFAQPVELLRGGESAAEIHLDSDPLRVSASGSLSGGSQFRYKGGLFAAAPSLRRLAALAGIPFAKHGRFADLDLRCDASIGGGTASLTNLRLDLDGNEYDGTLALLFDPHVPTLSGTLATNLLDVTPFLQGLPHPGGAYGRWSGAALDLADLGFANLDLRVSATQLHLNDIKIGDAALSVFTRPGYLDVALAEAEANDGRIRGHLTLSAHGKSIDLHASGSAASVDIRPMFRGSAVQHPLLGRLSGSLVVESSGDSVEQLMHHLSGHARVHVTGGQLVGFDLAAALSKEPRPRLRPRDPTASVTNFDTANFALRIADGTAQIADGAAVGDSWALSFGGSANLAPRSFDLWALARSTVAPGSSGAPLRLTVKGPWNDVRIVSGPAPPASAAPMASSAAPQPLLKPVAK